MPGPVVNVDQVRAFDLAPVFQGKVIGPFALHHQRARVEIGDGCLAYPSPGSLVELAHAKALREEFVQPWELEPMYLRKSDAEINWARRESA